MMDGMAELGSIDIDTVFDTVWLGFVASIFAAAAYSAFIV
mgnify:CR=1 FL=1